MKKQPKWGTLILSGILLCTSIPFPVFAKGEEGTEPLTIEETQAQVRDQRHNTQLQVGEPQGNDAEQSLEGEEETTTPSLAKAEEEDAVQETPLEFESPLLEKILKGSTMEGMGKKGLSVGSIEDFVLTKEKLNTYGYKYIHLLDAIDRAEKKGVLTESDWDWDNPTTISLKGLEQFETLSSFDNCGIPITDIESLPSAFMTQLMIIGNYTKNIKHTLNKTTMSTINQMDVSEWDFTFLTKMTKLTYLSISDTNLKSADLIQYLANPEGMTVLALNFNEIEDISMFNKVEFPQFMEESMNGSSKTMLHLASNRIQDLSPAEKYRWNSVSNQSVTLIPETMEFDNPLIKQDGSYQEITSARSEGMVVTTGDNHEKILIKSLPEGDTIDCGAGLFDITIDCSRLKSGESTPSELATIEDETLAEIIRNRLVAEEIRLKQNKKDPITKEELGKVKKIVIEENISSFSGLEDATQLKWLKYEGKIFARLMIPDLTPLKDLEELKYLDIKYTDLKDISVLASFKSKETMEGLDLMGNQISDAGALVGFTNVTSGINIQGNQITDFSVLKTMEGKLASGSLRQGPIIISPDARSFENPMIDFDGNYKVPANIEDLKGEISQSEDGKYFNYIGALPRNEELDLEFGFNVQSSTLSIEFGGMEETPKEETESTLRFLVYGMQEDIYVEGIHQPKITIWKGTTEEDATEENKVSEGTGTQWKLPIGDYYYRISHEGYGDMEGTVALGEKLLEKVVYLPYEGKQVVPQIKSFQLVDRSTKKPIGEAKIGPTIIEVVVEDEADREKVYSGKTMIKAEINNASAYQQTASASPVNGTFISQKGRVKELDGRTSYKSFHIHKAGMASLWLTGDTGLETRHVIVIKERADQEVVIFDTGHDNSIQLGTLAVPTEIGSNDIYQVNSTVQLVDYGKPAMDLLEYIKKLTGKTARYEKFNAVTEGKWYKSQTWKDEFDLANTPITEPLILCLKWSDSSTLGEYPYPFKVYFNGPGAGYGHGEEYLDLYFGKEEPTNKYDEPANVKVEKAGDPMTFKYVIKDTHALAYLYAHIGGKELPITCKDGVFRFIPAPSQDSDFFKDNEVEFGLMEKKYTNGIAFDLEKQYDITIDSEGPLVGFDYVVDWSVNASKGHAGYTIPFNVRGDEIEEVKVTAASGKEIEVVDVTEEFSTRHDAHYTFVMPEEPVTITVTGTVIGSEMERYLNLSVVDTAGNPISSETIESFRLMTGPYEYQVENVEDPIKVNGLTTGTTYQYVITLKDRGAIFGSFFVGEEDGDAVTITVDMENMVLRKTEEDVQNLLEVAKEHADQTEKYTKDSIDSLKATIKQVEHMLSLQKSYNEAFALLTGGIDQLEKIEPTDPVNPTDPVDPKEPTDPIDPGSTDPVVDKGKLQSYINSLPNLKAADYTTTTWNAYANALQQAKKILNDSSVTQVQVNQAKTNLETAYKNLVRKDDSTVNKASLRSYVNSLSNIKEADYTTTTWSTYSRALREAKDVLDNKNATQSQVDQAKKDLEKAYKDLVRTDKEVTETAKNINDAQKKLEASSTWSKMTDVATHWARDVIKYVMDKGYFVGTSETTFAPNKASTRAEFVTVLGRMAKIDTTKYTTNKMKDVSAGVYYEPYVNWAIEKGIAQGTGNANFSPNQSITREEMAVMLDKYTQTLGKSYNTIGSKSFADGNTISSWAQSSIDRMTAAGLLQGQDNNRFAPKTNFTRAEVAQVIYNLDHK